MSSLASQCLVHNSTFPNHIQCNFQAFDSNTIIIQLSFIGMLAVLLLFSIVFFRQLLQYRKDQQLKQLFGDTYIHVYIWIFLWLASSIIKTVINIIVYYWFMIQPPQEQVNEPFSFLVVSSNLFQFLDYCAPFCILYLMILIPYTWTNQLLLKINKNQEKQHYLPLQQRQKINRYFTILKIINVYIKATRVLFFILLAVEPFLFYLSNSEFFCNHIFLNSTVTYFDTFITLLVYAFGYTVSAFLRDTQLIIVPKSDQRLIRIQFLILLSVLISRLIANLYYKVLNFPEIVFQSNCLASQDSKQRVQAWLYLLTSCYIMHSLPISLILYIYRPSQTNRKLILNYVRDTMAKQSFSPPSPIKTIHRSVISQNTQYLIKSSTQPAWEKWKPKNTHNQQ